MFGKIKTNAFWCQILVQNVTAGAQCFDARPFLRPNLPHYAPTMVKSREGVKVAARSGASSLFAVNANAPCFTYGSTRC
jgi:hypothetical protein